MLRGQGKSRITIPAIWLMSDERVAEDDFMRAIARLPQGSAVVVRHYRLDAAERRALFARVRKAARRRGCLVVLAGEPGLAQAWRADGHHGPMPGPLGKPWLHSAAVHDAQQLRAAVRAGADAVLLSPLFATRSHPGAASLGAARFATLARRTSMAVMAMGGVHPRHAGLVRRLGADGFAAIDGLVPNAWVPGRRPI